MKYRIYKMYFKTGIRIGDNQLETNSIEMPADILFSAIVNEASQISEKLCEKIIEKFKNKCLKISDAFPFIGEEYLLPKPFVKISKEESSSTEKKLYKKIEHIPLQYYKSYIEGKSNPNEILKISSQLGKNQVATKIKYSENANNEIYSIGYYRFDPNNGLYFLLAYEEEEDLENFDEILFNLSFTGIGGKKSSGLGKFEIIEKDLPTEFENKIDTENAKILLTTSMYKKEELKHRTGDSNYTIVRRGGFIYSENPYLSKDIAERKKTMYFFKSGSTFEHTYQGDVFRVDKNYSHPVYRYGIAMWLEV